MLLITPHHGAAYLTTVSSGKLVFLREIKADFRLWHAWRDGLIYVDWSTQTLKHVDASGTTSDLSWPLPPQTSNYQGPICLAVVGNRAYVSGNYGPTDEPSLFSCSLDNPEPEWLDYYPVELNHRKQIDAMVVIGKRLIAVDDILVPKYLFFVDNADETLRQVSVMALPANGTYEHVLHAALHMGQLAVLSTTMNHGMHGTHITLYDLTDFEPKAHFSVHDSMESSEESFNPITMKVTHAFGSLLTGGAFGSKPLHFSSVANRLVFACGEAGIVILNPIQFVRARSLEAHENELIFRSVACHFSIDQLPLYQLETGSETAQPEMVTDIISAGGQGCVVVMRLSDNSLESIFLGSNFLRAVFQ